MLYRILCVLNVVGGFVAFLMLSMQGRDWLTIGYGLNPWLAFPLAFLAMVACLYFLIMFLKSFGVEERGDAYWRGTWEPEQHRHAAVTAELALKHHQRLKKMVCRH